jgi:hypothetical protein
MDPKTRSMLRVTLPRQYEDRQPIKDLVERLMGRDPTPRFEFIRIERRTSRRRPSHHEADEAAARAAERAEDEALRDEWFALLRADCAEASNSLEHPT